MKRFFLILLVAMLSLAGCNISQNLQPTLQATITSSPEPLIFDGQKAYDLAKIQLDLGARIPGSEAHRQTVELIQTQLDSLNWETIIQSDQYNDYEIKNIIGKRESSQEDPWIILAAHYDSRFVADNDPNPDLRSTPVDGANDGASGVSVLLELARVLPEDLSKNIWLVFFDLEDQGNISGWEWIIGSQSFVDTLDAKPDSVVILDMIGDKDLQVYYERNSDMEIQESIWKVGVDLGYSDTFIPEYKYSILDDHMPFINQGIAAVDIIDFDYPYWHTTQDTIEKISPESLEIIGKTIYHWLLIP